jgi:glycosyltransferase involved in cell wall biosynthesis
VKLSVVIPCYNEQESLPATLKRVLSVAQPLCNQIEVVLVDDGSRDATWHFIAEAAQVDPRVRGIRLSRNFGHQIALSAGLYAAQGDRIFIIDADLQDPPELLPKMMAALDAGADVAYGRRVSRGGESSLKLATAFIFYRFINWLSDIEIPKDTGDFRFVSRRALNAVLAMPEKHRFLRGMFAWVGFHQVPIDYDRAERYAGETKYPYAAMMRFAVTAITSFSVRPLRLAMMFSGVFAFAALMAVAYVVLGHFAGHTVQGWSSLMVVVLLIASCQFLLLGIIGEYLGRMFVEQKKRPLFVVMADTGEGASAP